MTNCKLLPALVLLLIAANSVMGQTLINSTGSTVQNSSITIEYSIGEIGIYTLSANPYIATEGLLQPLPTVKDCNLLRLIPTAFSPNKDNLNDCFSLKNWPATTSFELSLYNRWGQLVHYSNNTNNCWDGNLKGQPQPAGTYVYFVKASTATCGQIAGKGTLFLIR